MGVDFDKVLRRTGEFGNYQKLRFVLLCLAVAVLFQYTMFSLIFITFTPPYWCTVYLDGNDTELALNRTDTKTSAMTSSDECWVTINDTERTTTASEAFKCVDWDFDRSDYIETLTTEWNLVCDRSWWISLMMTLSSVFSAVGTLWFSIVQDSLGRKLGFFIALLVCIVPGSASAFAPNALIFVILRSIQANMIICGWTFPYILSLEIVGPSKRTFVTSVMVAVFAMGAASYGLVAWLCNHWKTLVLVSTVPFLIFFGYWPLLDESPRWLLTTGQTQKLRALVQKIANTNKLPFKKGEAFFFITENPLGRNSTRKTAAAPVWHLFSSANIRTKTVIICYLFMANALVYTGLAFNVENLEGNRYFMFSMLMLMEVPAAVAINIMLDRFGRILPMSFLMIAGGISAICTSQVPTSMPIVVCVMAALSKFGISGSFGVLCQLAGELFPTPLRGTGTGLGGFLGNMSTAAIPFILASAQTFKTLPMVVMGLCSVSGGIVCLLLPETMGAILPEALADCGDTPVGLRTLFLNVTLRNLRDARTAVARRRIAFKKLVPTDLTRLKCRRDSEEDENETPFLSPGSVQTTDLTN